MTDRPEPERLDRPERPERPERDRAERDRAERLDRFDDDRPGDRAGDRGESGDESLVRHEEELRVGVERVRTGRVRLRKKVVEEQRTITVTVRVEEAELVEESLDPEPGVSAAATPQRERSGRPDERVGGSAAVDRADDAFDTFDAGDADDADDAVELVLYEERPVVTMERVPVERVRLRRVSHGETQQVSGQVQVEDVVLDRDDLSGGPGADLSGEPGAEPSADASGGRAAT